MIVSIPTPRERHDQQVLARVAPMVRTLRASPALEAMWYQRVNKPDWGLRVHVLGESHWLDREARAALESGLGVAGGGASFVSDDPDDKWTGGSRESEFLKPFHHHDTWACLAALEADAAGALGSRVRYSLVMVERLLEILGIRQEARLEFYRRSFDWAIALGRWDGEVFEALERTFANQRDSLAVMLEAGDGGPGTGPWPALAAARIGRELLAAVRPSLGSVSGDRLDLAIFAAHAHSNRMGIHASREAALRYLVWRARGGSAPAS